MRRLLAALALPVCLSASLFAAAQIQQPAAPDGVARLLRELERIIVNNDAAAYTALLTPISNSSSPEILDEWIAPGVSRAVIKERMRLESQNIPKGEGLDVYVDALSESGISGRVGTWLLELRRDASKPGEDAWRINKVTVLTTLRGLYKLSLNPKKQFTVRNFELKAEDFTLTLPQGSAFVAEIDGSTATMVLLGRGEATFSPASPAERGQVKIYGGSETLQTKFSWVYLRMYPDDFDEKIQEGVLQPRAVDSRDFRRADSIFQENSELTFSLDLADLSRERWSVLPKPGDIVAEFQAGSHLTYMHSSADQEDIRFFDRTRVRTISIYPSKARLAWRGAFFSEDEQTDYDIINYDIDASFDPKREWIEGRATLLVTPRGPASISSLLLTLNEALTIRSVTSRRLGYLMALRVKGQNDVIVNLPTALQPNEAVDIEVVYGGRLPAVPPEREALELAAQREDQSDFFSLPLLPSYIYTGRSNWYPQGQVSDYATAHLTLRVPAEYSTVASGALDEGFPKLVPADPRDPRAPQWKEYRFSATQPVRYLGWATSKFVHVDDESVRIPSIEGQTMTGVSYNFTELGVESSGMLQRRARELSLDTQDVLKFYGTLIGDMPYQSFTLAVVERNMPGGHSPPYFAALSQPPPATPIAWRSDPAYFDSFPEFFLAHEAAHQWWGQAIGWKNYHEQWISEGFAQYFAALYAEHLKRGDVFEQVVKQMARWTLARSDQGPVYLGYRLGHIKNDSRTFRALVYNKGALTLHMLRLLVGDDMFFRSLRRFYTTWRFRKAGTEDVKAAFEEETGRKLDRYFERWIYGSSLPRIKFSYTAQGDAVVARFEQVGDVFDVPILVTVQYANNTSVDVLVPVTEQIVEYRIPTAGAVRSVEANRDDAAPVVFVR